LGEGEKGRVRGNFSDDWIRRVDGSTPHEVYAGDGTLRPVPYLLDTRNEAKKALSKRGNVSVHSVQF
jgi:hypothetical protein